MTFLAPQFLATRIGIIALITSGAFLIIFSDFVTKRIMLTFADSVKQSTHRRIKGFGKDRNHRGLEKYGSKLLSESLATALFLLYVYFGTTILAEFIVGPILLRLQHIVLITTLIIFFTISYTINTKSIRRRLMKF